MDVPVVAWLLTIARIVGLLVFGFVVHVRRAHLPPDGGCQQKRSGRQPDNAGSVAPSTKEIRCVSRRIQVSAAIVGPVAEVPDLHLAVVHAAVTLAPAVGRLVAREFVRDTDGFVPV